MFKKLFLFLFPALMLAAQSDKPAFRLFDDQGVVVKYEKLLKDCEEADIILFGELHNNPIVHWLQYELSKDLFEIKGDNLVLGAEMFETDNQLILNEYLDGLISVIRFETEAKLWPNYKTDYKPLVNMAKDNKLKFIATNIPRRYASMVSKGGFEILEKLTDEAKKMIAPLPIQYDANLNCYKSMLSMGGGAMGQHVNINLPKAQAIKDATMSNNIYKNWEEGKTFIHYHGTYHSDNFESIVWYLKQKNPDLKILSIGSVSQEIIDKLDEENLGKANIIICVAESMTKTY
ncbi:ChaN family lipoprotein [Bacteroidota bacterium]